MELRHLRYFVAVAEAENVSRAALKLHVSQPALSRQVRDLEAELGFPLLERTAKSVRLTDAGRVFLTEARAVVERAEAAVAKARAIATDGRGEIHVGYAPSPTVRILPPALRAFQAQRPKVRVRLHDLSSEEIVAGLCDETLDIAILVRPTRRMLRGLRFEELARDAICVAVAPKHPFARHRSVAVAEIARASLIVFSRRDYPDYHEMLDNVFAGTKSKLRIAEEHDNSTSLIAAIEAGAGVAVCAESMVCTVGLRLKVIPIKPPPPPLMIGAAWRASGLSPTAAIFLACAKEVSPKGPVTD
jgi:DNA-binding transcriptional LysR family regulator